VTSGSELSAAARALLMRTGVSILTNGLLKRGLRNQFLHGIAPVDPGLPNMVGPACTLRLIPAREDIDTLSFFGRDDNVHRRAIEECPPGAVLVIDSGCDPRSASAGDLLIGRLKMRGCAGIVTDGGYRDIAGVAKLSFPAYQRRTASPATPLGLHAVDANVPIGCAGVAVYPGDVVVGDGEGVVILPAGLVEELAAEAAEASVYDQFAEEKIAEGRPLIGLFPATEASRREYEAWKTKRSG
jgi:regulator of RNase E activity RraA